MYPAHDDLARTRQLFDTWRATRSHRTTIPSELWDKAVSLLNHYPVTRVARELRLAPAKLRKRSPASSQTLALDNTPAP